MDGKDSYGQHMGRGNKDPVIVSYPLSGCPVHTNLAEKDQKIGNRSLWGQGGQVKGGSQPKASWLDGLLTWALEG